VSSALQEGYTQNLSYDTFLIGKIKTGNLLKEKDIIERI